MVLYVSLILLISIFLLTFVRDDATRLLVLVGLLMLAPSGLRQRAALGVYHTQRTALHLFNQPSSRDPDLDDGDGKTRVTLLT